jgi:uncharacterized protein (TIGR00730 family)
MSDPMPSQPPKSTTPELEELRKGQAKKRAGVDPAHVLDKAIYQLWETINDLDQIQPERVEHYRVSIFGSSRIRRGDPIYEEVKSLSFELAKMGIDIVTGGGPGLMEAANRGAADEGEESIGLNIVLPHEQLPNPYVTPDLSFQFHYFALRKMHFLLRARAVAVFPGGYGTFDEMFELLTLIQTGKVRPLPILLFGRDYWNKVVNFDAMVDEGVISPHDLDLLHWSEDAGEAWDYVMSYYAEHPAPQPVQSGPPE